MNGEILRIYEPSECDPETDSPLDFEVCRTCGGGGEAQEVLTPDRHPADPACEVKTWPTCPPCNSHGSLREAALAGMLRPAARGIGGWLVVKGVRWRVAKWTISSQERTVITLSRRTENGLRETWETSLADLPADEARCEDCGHPMSDGTWERTKHALATTPASPDDPAARFRSARTWFRRGEEPVGDFVHEGFHAHYSPCDEGCRHGGPIRCDSASDLTTQWDTILPDVDGDVVRAILAGPGVKVEASWRPVDIRTLGRPSDLRPDHVAVLCLRCWAARRAL